MWNSLRELNVLTAWFGVLLSIMKMPVSPPSPRLPFAWRFGSVRLLQIDSSFVYLVDGPQGQKVFCLGEGHTCRFTAA